MKKHFVTFYSLGTFVSEQRTEEIDAWDPVAAKAMAKGVKERYGATPYGFRFSTRERGENDLDSRESASSPMYYLGGKIETYDDVVARNAPDEAILRDNMRINGIKRIIVNNNSWKHTAQLDDNDVVLQWP